MRSTWFLWILLIAGMILFVKYGKRVPVIRSFFDRVKLKVPLAGGIIQSIQVSRFVRTLSIMVSSNVPILDAVRISSKVIENSVIFNSLNDIGKRLRSGAALSEILGNNIYMPEGSAAMLRIAEESGEIGEMLRRIADESEETTRLRVKHLLALLEPAVILILAAVVLLVVLAIFLAIMEMNAIQ